MFGVDIAAPDQELQRGVGVVDALAADDWTPAAPCSDLIAAAKANGEPTEIVTYPDAYHDFDHPNLPVHVVEDLAFTADGDGQAHTGTNPAARADAIDRVMEFLAR